MGLKINKSLFRYVAVGLLTNAIGYAIYLLITWLGAPPKSTMSVLYVIGASLGFLGNRMWAFAHKGSWLTSMWRYGLAHVMGYTINFMLLTIFVDRLGFPHQLVQGAAIFIVGGFLFLAFRYFVFPKADSPGKKPLPSLNPDPMDG